MTMQFPVPNQTKVNEPLFASPADWISPGFDDPLDPNADFSAGPPPGRWLFDPPPAEGRKVVISEEQTILRAPFESSAAVIHLRRVEPILANPNGAAVTVSQLVIASQGA